MPEQLEVEIKFFLEDPERIRAALPALGVIHQGFRNELNIHFDTSSRSLSAQNIVLRLREIQAGQHLSYLLTLKTPVRNGDPVLSIRREIELSVDDGKALQSILAILGYIPCWRYEKRRDIYIYEKLEIVIDQLPFGWFTEIEGPADSIKNFAGKLGLSLDQGIRLTYAQIFENIRQVLGLGLMDMTFESFKDITVLPEHYLGGGR
nr:class IV adenylate cyclase [Anaerolineae bacterium]